MPFISFEYIEKLESIIAEKIARSEKIDALVTRRASGFCEPFNAFYNKSCTKKIREHLERSEYKLAFLLRELNLSTLEDFDEKLFFNINYQDDLDKARDVG
jgi:molybdopterin-guanine dinucleotide biosynthesis protein A